MNNPISGRYPDGNLAGYLDGNSAGYLDGNSAGYPDTVTCKQLPVADVVLGSTCSC